VIEPALQRILTALRWVYRVLHGIMLTVFVGLVTMVLVAWLGAGIWVALGAGVVGLALGAALSWRVWIREEPPVVKPLPAEMRTPGVQDEFERVQARHRVLVFLLISAWLTVVALYLTARHNWPVPHGLPRERVMIAAAAVAAMAVLVAILNWRCPHCRRNLGKSVSIRQCPHCGVVLRG